MMPFNTYCSVGEGQPLLTGIQHTLQEAESNDSVIDVNEVIPKPTRAFSFQDARMNITAGMMDLSLFIANVNQLANVIRTPQGVGLMMLEKITTVLICLSIFLQVFVGLLLIWRPPDPMSTIRSNRGIITCIFLILVINVFVACLNNEQQHFPCPSKNIVPTKTTS